MLAQGVAVPVGARAFEIIEVLVQSANQLVTRDDIMERIWPGSSVGENTLHVHISAIRKAFGPDRGRLKTASGRGYRLIGNWTARTPNALAERVDPTPPGEAAEPVPGNLPAAAGGLIGRATAVQHLRDLISAYRIVTLTGAGGIGKTSLALTVARAALHEYGDGVWLVELASLSDPALVVPMVAQVLRLGLSEVAVTADAVARAVRGKHLLLVLDNCEHVINAAADLAEALVRQCPRVTVLATTREVLRIQGELVYRVPPLEVPADDQAGAAEILGHSAAELFVARTRESSLDFVPDARSLKAIAAVCRHLDGIPLALEFAAARAATLGVEQVLSRLDDRFALLTSGRRTALPKHRTLQATLNWSHELLSVPERLLLRRLAIFEGAFSLEAATAVIASHELLSPVITDVIANLVSKSLLTLVAEDTPARFRLLETTRVYAREKLADAGEMPQLARRHAEYYKDFFQRIEYRPEATPATIVDVGNARAALEWCFDPGGDTAIGIALASVVAPAFLAMSLLAECHHWTGLAIRLLGDADRGTSEEMHLQACFGLSSMHMSGQSDMARLALDRSLAIAEERGDVLNQFGLLGMLHRFHIREGEFNVALAFAKRRRVLVGAVEDPGCIALSQMVLGRSLHLMGDMAGARAELEAALRNWSVPHRTSSIYLAYDRGFLPGGSLARTLWMQGHPVQAVECAHQAVAAAQRMEKPQSHRPDLTLGRVGAALDRRSPERRGAHGPVHFARRNAVSGRPPRSGTVPQSGAGDPSGVRR